MSFMNRQRFITSSEKQKYIKARKSQIFWTILERGAP